MSQTLFSTLPAVHPGYSYCFLLDPKISLRRRLLHESVEWCNFRHTQTHTHFSAPFAEVPVRWTPCPSSGSRNVASFFFFPLLMIFFLNPVLFLSFSFWSVLPRQNGRVAIVTGGARGMGYETSRHLASLGTHVVIGNTSHSLSLTVSHIRYVWRGHALSTPLTMERIPSQPSCCVRSNLNWC